MKKKSAKKVVGRFSVSKTFSAKSLHKISAIEFVQWYNDIYSEYGYSQLHQRGNELPFLACLYII